jgi:hypothetical protein
MPERPAPAVVEVRFTLPLALPPAGAWERLRSEIDHWWPADYRVLPGSRMQLDARPGGGLRELAAGDDGVLWYTVQAVSAPRWIMLAGPIGPPFGGPALSLLRLELREVGGGSELDLHDAILGRADAAAVEAGWRAILAGFVA